MFLFFCLCFHLFFSLTASSILTGHLPTNNLQVAPPFGATSCLNCEVMQGSGQQTPMNLRSQKSASIVWLFLWAILPWCSNLPWLQLLRLPHLSLSQGKMIYFQFATRWKVILGKVPCYRLPFWRWSRQVGINSSRRNPALSLSSIFCVKVLLHDDFKAGPPARLPKVLHHGRQLVYHPRQPGADLGSTSGKECFSQLDKNQSKIYKLAS